MSNDQKIALVTGATRGIGKEIALALAKQHIHVIAIGRTQGALEELDDEIQALGESATLVPLDLRDLPAIDRLQEPIAQRWGKIDYVIGNAGMLGNLTPLPHAKPQEFQDVLTVNLSANFHLIRSMDLLMKQAENARCIMVSSGAGRNPRAFWGAYAISKAALDTMVKIYARELEGTRVKIASFDPGATATKMRAAAMPGEDPSTLPTAQHVGQYLVDLITGTEFENGKDYKFRK